jgi:uncharacterized protein involved in oxidation of intracellular sulfur
MKNLFILNDPPYGTERCYNALRLAHALMKKDAEATVTVFLMAEDSGRLLQHRADAERCAHL